MYQLLIDCNRIVEEHNFEYRFGIFANGIMCNSVCEGSILVVGTPLQLSNCTYERVLCDSSRIEFVLQVLYSYLSVEFTCNASIEGF